MLKWLNNWRQAISILKPAVEEQPAPSPEIPKTFLHPAPRKTVAKLLSDYRRYKLAIDPLESSLFYRSLEGKIVSRSLVSGAIEWQSEESGSPLRVTDQILWAVQSDAIAAYSTIDGQLLMRSNQLWLPDEPDEVATYSQCDLSEQTLRLLLFYDYDPYDRNGGMATPPPWQGSLAYQINLITGEVTKIDAFECTPRYGGPNWILGDDWRPIFQEVEEQIYPSVSSEQLFKINRPLGITESAQLQTASVIIHHSHTAYLTQKIVSVFSNQPPYSQLWEAIINEYRPEKLEPPRC
ncbi:hypothetical protein QUB75_12840 [Microcoleus sp. K1-B6]|uniref:hypothetical protein n=1 Tax=unclassified Microcoleus TaxID=2642155 RepID=UPI002FD3F5EB